MSKKLVIRLFVADIVVITSIGILITTVVADHFIVLKRFLFNRVVLFSDL